MLIIGISLLVIVYAILMIADISNDRYDELCGDDRKINWVFMVTAIGLDILVIHYAVNGDYSAFIFMCASLACRTSMGFSKARGWTLAITYGLATLVIQSQL